MSGQGRECGRWRCRTTASIPRPALTLVELLVVIGILVLLMGLLLPAVQATREAARVTECRNNVRQILVGITSHQSLTGAFPPGVEYDRARGMNNYNDSRASFLVHTLPYLELPGVAAMFDWGKSWHPPNLQTPWPNTAICGTRVPLFICPSSPTAGRATTNYSGRGDHATNYMGVLGPKGFNRAAERNYATETTDTMHGGYSLEGAFSRNRRHGPGEFRDGLSTTLMIGEMSWIEHPFHPWAGGLSDGWAYAPVLRNVVYPLKTYTFSFAEGRLGANDVSFGGAHAGSTVFGMGDGSLRGFSEAVSLDLLKQLASRGGTEITEDQR